MILRPNLVFTMKMNSLDTKFITKLFKDTIFFNMLRNFISNAHLNYFIHSAFIRYQAVHYIL